MPETSDELKPHRHVPSTMHMGDCSVCGNLQDSPCHIGYEAQPNPTAADTPEPVAWRRVRSDGRVTFWASEVPDSEPLYAKPVAADTGLVERLEKAEYELKRFHEVRANAPDWENLWAEAREAEEATAASLSSAQERIRVLSEALESERIVAEYAESASATLQSDCKVLADALKGLVGLVQLVRSRDDCPIEIKQALTDQYRLDNAFAALTRAAGGQTDGQ